MLLNRVEVIQILEAISPAISDNAIHEQFECFIFQDKYVCASDGQVRVSHKLKTGIYGAVKAKETLSILRKINEEKVNLYIEDNELRIDGDKFTSGISLQTELIKEFDFVKEPRDFRSLPKNFMEGLRLCCLSAAKPKQSAEYSYIHILNNIIESCDGFRASRYKLEKDMEIDALIFTESANFLKKLNLTMYELGEDNWLHFTDGSGLIFSTLLANVKYLSIDSLFEVNGKAMKLPVELTSTLDRCSVFSQKDDIVRIDIAKTKIVVSSSNEVGWFREEKEIKRQRMQLSFDVSAKILNDILKITNRVITDSTDAMLFRTKNYKYSASIIPKGN